MHVSYFSGQIVHHGLHCPLCSHEGRGHDQAAIAAVMGGGKEKAMNPHRLPHSDFAPTALNNEAKTPN